MKQRINPFYFEFRPHSIEEGQGTLNLYDRSEDALRFLGSIEYEIKLPVDELSSEKRGNERNIQEAKKKLETLIIEVLKKRGHKNSFEFHAYKLPASPGEYNEFPLNNDERLKTIWGAFPAQRKRA